MAAVLAFQEGLRATLRDGVWECDDANMREILEITTALLPAGYRPNPDADVAAEVAVQVGATIVSADVEIPDAPEEDAVF